MVSPQNVLIARGRAATLLPVLLALPIPLLCAAGARGADPLTPEKVLERAEARFRTITDYACVAEGEAVAGTKRESGAYRVWYRQPGLLRLKVLKGRNRGSEIVMDGEGGIRGRKGGLLKPIVVRLKRDDSRLFNIRGVPVTEITWDAFYQKWRRMAARPGVKASLAARAGAGDPYEVVLSGTRDGKAVREHYHVDPEQWVLLEGELWEDGTRVDHIRFQDIELNRGLTERSFRL